MNEQAIIEQNRGLHVIDPLGSTDSVSFLVSEHRFEHYTVQIVKVQWTKTQKAYCIRILNFNTGNRPHIQIPCDTLRNCKAFVNEAAKTGIISLWTGHTAKVGNPIVNGITLKIN